MVSWGVVCARPKRGNSEGGVVRQVEQEDCAQRSTYRDLIQMVTTKRQEGEGRVVPVHVVLVVRPTGVESVTPRSVTLPRVVIILASFLELHTCGFWYVLQGLRGAVL